MAFKDVERGQTLAAGQRETLAQCSLSWKTKGLKSTLTQSFTHSRSCCHAAIGCRVAEASWVQRLGAAAAEASSQVLRAQEADAGRETAARIGAEREALLRAELVRALYASREVRAQTQGHVGSPHWLQPC